MMTITISKDVLSQQLKGETVLLDMQGEQYFGLDAVGTRVWQLLQQGSDRSTLIDTLLGEYEVERLVLENDIDELLGSLEQAGLITIG